MSCWGVAIPGLAMHSSELPEIEGLFRLENPEVGEGVKFDAPYTIEDIAEIHARTIQSLPRSSIDELTIIGMSMGGMVASVLASRFRSLLPRNTRFRFLVTSPNATDLPAIPDTLLETWKTARSGVNEDFRRILAPFLSPAFRMAQPERAEAYYAYRAMGGNRQSARAFMRQMTALRGFQGEKYFPQVDSAEAAFIGGAHDEILGPAHNEALKRLLPEASHVEIEDLGHMINFERPEAFHPN